MSFLETRDGWNGLVSWVSLRFYWSSFGFFIDCISLPGLVKENLRGDDRGTKSYPSRTGMSLVRIFGSLFVADGWSLKSWPANIKI